MIHRMPFDPVVTGFSHLSCAGSTDAEALMSATVLWIFLIAEMALYVGFSVGLFFLNAHLIDRKLNLT